MIINTPNLNMFWSKIFDNTCIRRCLYQKMKNLVEYDSSRARNYFIFDCFIFVYASIRLLIGCYTMKINYQIPSNNWYKIERDDPYLNYMKQNSDKYNEVVPLIILGIELFSFLCQVRLYQLNIQKKVWKFWYQILVINQNAYNQFKFYENQLVTTAKANEIANRFRQYKFASMVPDYVINNFAFIYSKYLIQSNLENVNRDKYLDIKILDPPNLPIKYRLKLLNILIIGDNIWFAFQIFACKLCFYFIINIIN